MEIVIIDPGYAHPHAHHEMVNLAIHQALQKKNVNLQVFSAKDLDQSAQENAQVAGMSVVPYFMTPCYPQNASSLPAIQHEELSRMFAHELVALFGTGTLQGGECLLLHTGFSFHLSGLAQALWYLEKRIPSRFLISMMFHPGARLSPNQPDNMEYLDSREYLRHKLALELLQMTGRKVGVKVSLSTSCHAYQRVYQSLWTTGEVLLHPAVSYQPIAVRKQSKRDGKPRVLLYLGGAKADKGIEFAAKLGIVAAKALPQAEFVFHFNNQFPDAGRFTAIIDELRRAGDKYQNVEILQGNLSAEGYDECLQSCQIICVLYDPAFYGFKTSGVLWDAIRCTDIDWLVTEKTWVDDELAEFCIPRKSIAYGNVTDGIEQLRSLLNKIQKNSAAGQYSPNVDLNYLRFINSSFGDWLYDQFNSQTFNQQSKVIVEANQNHLINCGRILVVRTQYGHFSPLSGPGGFIPHLRELGYAVEERLIPLGNELLKDIPGKLKQELSQIIYGYLHSYQENSIAVETEIQREEHRYDIIHFVDGEHCGLLSALYRLRTALPSHTKLVVTYHQPRSVMQQIVSNSDYLRGFDRIQLMSPCQKVFFESVVTAEKICVIPHGLAPELLGESLPPLIVGLNAKKTISRFDDLVRARKILLTVGNWLRDFDKLLATAEKLAAREDLVFVIVSKGLDLETCHLDNVLVLNQGISDAQLHALYLRSTLLFLPLQDGAANNAILEAMAHGLPIVTTDLPSMHYYTQGLAVLSTVAPENYAATLESTLTEISIPEKRHQISNALRQRAQELTWESVAGQMHEMLYTPLLTSV